jgi:L-threonylcarbamoyladenylate synthase
VYFKPLRIYRPGFITKEEIEEVCGAEVIYYRQDPESASPSPGLKYTHYAPKAQVDWWDGSELRDDAFYMFTSSVITAPNAVNFDDAPSFARALYDQFRQADRLGYSKILIQKPEYDYPALLNRIEKAIGR